MSRRSEYTEATGEKIIEHLSENGSVRETVALIGISRSTLSRWCENSETFGAAIARAKREGYDNRAEIAVANAKAAGDAGLGRLAFDADRWYLSKIDPKRYGDKLDLTTGGEKLPSHDPGDVAAKAAALLATAKGRKDG